MAMREELGAQAHAPLAVIEALIKLQPSALRTCDNASSTPLHLAAGGGFARGRRLTLALVETGGERRRTELSQRPSDT